MTVGIMEIVLKERFVPISCRPVPPVAFYRRHLSPLLSKVFNPQADQFGRYELFSLQPARHLNVPRLERPSSRPASA